jgi:wobble nucleotide-excising tRNase
LAENLSNLSKNNFIYGSNGSGKTTISRVIANETQYPDCTIKWRGGSKLETLVYNRDFVENNFNQTSELKGIFTLGDKNPTVIQKIADAKVELDKFSKDIQKNLVTLTGC